MTQPSKEENFIEEQEDDGLEQLFEEKIPGIIPPEDVEELLPALSEMIAQTRGRIQRLRKHGLDVIVEEHVNSSLKGWLDGDRKNSAYRRYRKYMLEKGIIPHRIYKSSFFRSNSPRAGCFLRWSHIERKGLWPGTKVVLKDNPKKIFTVAKIRLDCKLVLEERPKKPVDSRDCMPAEQS